MAFILEEDTDKEASYCETSLHHRPSICRAWRLKGKKTKDKGDPSVVCLLHSGALELIRDVRLSKEQKTLPWGLCSAFEEERSIW